MNNNTAKELLALARHYEQFNINSAHVELLKKAAKELEEYSQVCEDIGGEQSKYAKELDFNSGFEWNGL